MADTEGPLRTVIDPQHISPDADWVQGSSLLYQNLTKVQITPGNAGTGLQEKNKKKLTN